MYAKTKKSPWQNSLPWRLYRLCGNGSEKALEVLVSPNNGGGVEGVGLGLCPCDNLGNVLLLDALDADGQIHGAFELLYPFDELESLFLTRLALNAADLGKLGKTLVGGGAILAHYMGQNGGHCKAVGNAVKTAESVANGVDIANAAAGEASSCEEAGALHILSGFHVVAVAVSGEEIIIDELNCVLRQLLFKLSAVSPVGVAFNGVAKSIHTGGGGYEGGQTAGKLGVKNCVIGDKVGVIDGCLVVGGGVGDNGGNGGLAAGAGGGGHGEEGGNLLHNLQNTLQLGNTLAGADNAGAYGLGAVHGSAAAEGDDGLAAVFLVGLETCFNIVAGGVNFYIVENGVGNAQLIHAVQHGVQQTETQQGFVGYNEDIIKTLFLYHVGQLGDRAGAFNIVGHMITHEIVAELHNGLESAAPKFTHFVLLSLFQSSHGQGIGSGRNELNGINGAALFAKTAGYAVIGVAKLSHSSNIPVVGGGGNGETIVGAALHAKGAAGASFCVNIGLGPFAALGGLGHGHALLILYALLGANLGAGSAADAFFAVYAVALFQGAGDGTNGANPGAEGAAYAFICDVITLHGINLRIQGS